MLDSLADELLVACFAPLSSVELCAVAATARRYRRAASADVLWQRLVLASFALQPGLAAAAARRAGSYFALFRDESLANKRAAPWRVAGRHTQDAFVERGLQTTSATSPQALLDAGLSPSTPGAAAVAPLGIVFLIDGRCVEQRVHRGHRQVASGLRADEDVLSPAPHARALAAAA
jgi:hypothetical protein